MMQLRNHLLPLLHAASTRPSQAHSRAWRLLSTSTTVPAAFSLEDYLVASCGLAPAQAREVSKKASRDASCKGTRRPLEELSYSRLHSASNPDAILDLLSRAGLSRVDIAAVVSADPLLLRASLKNIGPRLVGLRDRLGLSTPEIARFLVMRSDTLRDGDIIPKLEFLIAFYGSFEQVMIIAKRNIRLFRVSLERSIKPNVALLRQWGVQDITQLCSNNAWMLTYNPERVKEFLLRAEELGVPPTSRMFRHAVAVVACNSKEKVAAKLEFLKRTLGCSGSYVSTLVSKMPGILRFSEENLLRKIEFFKRALGCSEFEVSTALSKQPTILRLSEEALLRKIEFLVNEAAVEPRYIVERPVLLTYSLEKRLVPRDYVMKVLQEQGLLGTNMSIYSLASCGEETFKSKFIDYYKDSIPGLGDAYAMARAGIVPSRV